MFLRHSIIYLFARGIPGVIGFLTILIYTRLLSPGAYGEYGLVVSTAVLVNALLYQWLNASLLRFLPQYQDQQQKLLTTLLAGFLCISLLAGAGGLVVALSGDEPGWGRFILFSVTLIWVQAWFTINLELARSRLMPVRYGLMSGLRTVTALMFGTVLIYLGTGAYGALAGLILSYFVSGLWASRTQWRDVRWHSFDRKLINSLLAYGLPLTASYALGAVMSSIDRFMLAAMIDEAATGLYVAGQGLAGWDRPACGHRIYNSLRGNLERPAGPGIPRGRRHIDALDGGRRPAVRFARLLF
jgi:O-antigen/teichoic acid export membrane protein